MTLPAPRRCVFGYPGDWHSRTGGYRYDREIVAGLRALGWTVDLLALGEGFPLPDARTVQQADAAFAALADHTLVVVDGLAFGALPEVVARHAQRLRCVALVHHPLALESGLPAAQTRALHDSERRALACARRVIVTSAATARLLPGFDVPPARIVVVEPGTDAAPLAQGSGGDAVVLLCVATLTPRKGHLTLVEALAGLREQAWTLHLAGSTTRDPATAQAVQAAIAAHGLAGRVVVHGEVDDDTLQGLYHRADAFVLPSLFEGYGMVLAEALARGLPVLASRAGAMPDTVSANAGLLVAPGDVAAWRTALTRLIGDPAWRTELAAGARAARARLPTWAQASERFATALE